MSDNALKQENVGLPELQIEHRYLAAMDAL